MKRFYNLLIPLVFLCTFAAVARAADDPRQTIPLDAQWKFDLGDPSNAQTTAFDDAGWRTLDLPHDWSIELPFDENAPTGGAGAFLPAGVGWYRKHLTLPAADQGKHVFVEFDGIVANSDAYLNGHLLGHRPSGTVSLRYDLTPYLTFGEKENVLAVRVDDSRQPAARWYTGAGINRHVRLIIQNPVHVELGSTFVTTPAVSAAQARINVATRVVNDADEPQSVSMRYELLSPGGKVVADQNSIEATALKPHQSVDVFQVLTVNDPERWDLDHPALYRAVTTVFSGEQALDIDAVSFGIREFHFDADTGFWLNGKNLKLKGVGLHEDCGGLGTATPPRAWERRLAALKELGVNAIRPAHGAADPAFLDLCDRMGFCVMDEFFDCWTVGKTPYDYHLYFNEWSKIDARDTVRRDRNHPSIILYSAGNEIHDTRHPEIAKPILRGLIQVFHENDPTRPVTQALFRPNVSHDYDDGLADLLDVVGQNYRENEILAAHAQKPSRKIIGTENGHDRRFWLACRDNPPYAGQFLWTGMDYLGESRNWPIIASTSGLLDRTGWPRPLAYERQSWWSQKPMVYLARRIAPPSVNEGELGGFAPLRRPQVLFPDWSPKNRGPHDENVEVYSNCPRVELFLNDRSLGVKDRTADDAPRNWQVPYEAGTIKAVASDATGRILATRELKTVGKPAKLLLSADEKTLTPTWDDVCTLTATVADEAGVLVPDAQDSVTFTVTGPASIVAVDNADNASHESFRGNHRRAYQGRCIAVLRATAPQGEIRITASAPGLAPAVVTLAANRSDAPAP